MERKCPISNTVQLQQTLNLADDVQKANAIDYSTKFKDITDKVNKLKPLVGKGKVDAEFIRYLPYVTSIVFQGIDYAFIQSVNYSPIFKDFSVLCHRNKKFLLEVKKAFL